MVGDRGFDAADENWVSVAAARFFFEPHCTEFEPTQPGQLIVLFGNDDTRHRGVQIRLVESGLAIVWVPPRGRAFWLPDLVGGQSAHAPWEGRLREFDHESGARVVI